MESFSVRLIDTNGGFVSFYVKHMRRIFRENKPKRYIIISNTSKIGKLKQKAAMYWIWICFRYFSFDQVLKNTYVLLRE